MPGVVGTVAWQCSRTDATRATAGVAAPGSLGGSRMRSGHRSLAAGEGRGQGEGEVLVTPVECGTENIMTPCPEVALSVTMVLGGYEGKLHESSINPKFRSAALLAVKAPIICLGVQF